MKRIETIFQNARSEHRKLLMPFLCGGSPAGTSLSQLLPRLEHAGAGIVEIGIPFSDPIADGPVIAAAMHQALERGVTPESVFEEVAAARPNTELGMVAMVSVSLVYARGVERFIGMAKDAGFDGFIFPDAPLEESEELVDAASEAGLTASLLVAPTTPADRAALVAEKSTGFLYLLARSGITGERSDAPNVAEKVAELRNAGSPPIACGFGISTAEHVAAVVKHADAAIVGSALVRTLNQAADADESIEEAAEAFVADLATGLVDMDSLPGVR